MECSFAFSKKSPARVTIFGYSAPISDVEAITIMKEAWGNPEKDKQFTQLELIDIQSLLAKLWWEKLMGSTNI